jgi:hypothetical protein
MESLKKKSEKLDILYKYIDFENLTITSNFKEEVPEDIMKKFWYIFHKDNVLTFLDEPGMASKLLNMDIYHIQFINIQFLIILIHILKILIII